MRLLRRRSKSGCLAILMQERSVGERAGLLAYHWLNAEEWEKALGYTLKAAEQAPKTLCRS